MSMFLNLAKPDSMDKISYGQYQWAEKITLITDSQESVEEDEDMEPEQ